MMGSRVNLYLNGMLLGDLESMDTAILHDMKPGVYDVVMVLPNQLNREFRISTDPAAKPVEVVPSSSIAFHNFEYTPLYKDIEKKQQ